MTKGVCFINWVGRCLDVEGSQKYYNVVGCENWPSAEISRLEAVLKDLEVKKAGLPDSSKHLLDKQLERAKNSIDKVTDLNNGLCR